MSLYLGTRYTRTGIYDPNSQGKPILEIREKAQFNLNNATYYTVIEGDTVDGIAYKQYGNAQYYWAILDANPNYMSELDIEPGDVIAIPSLDEVLSFIG
jgi:phage tail protein X